MDGTVPAPVPHPSFVIASEARQSRAPRTALDCRAAAPLAI